jgi:hypothetical protein
MPYFFSYYKPMIQDKSSIRKFNHSSTFSQDVYIVAPKIIQLGSSFSEIDGATNSVAQEGTFSGYLMSP